MRILIASRNFFPAGVVGGAQTSIRYLAHHLIERGHAVAVASVDDRAASGVHAATGIPEYRVEIRNSSRHGGASPLGKIAWHFRDRYAGAMRRPLGEVLDAFAPDVVMSNVMAGITLGLWDAAAERRVPVVHMVHDYYLLCVKSGMRRGGANCARPCPACRFAAAGNARRKSGAVTDVIYVSGHVRAVHEAAGIFAPAVRGHVHHGPYRPATSPEAIAARRRSHGGEGITFGFFGRIAPDKGVVELIETLRPLAGRWRLLIGGGGPEDYLDKVRTAARGAPVELLGVRTPDEFYASIDALIVPSLWHDPAPRVVYEAGAHGVVSIVSDRGGLPELVGFGARGFVYEPERPKSLRAIAQQLVDDRSVLDGKLARWRAESAQFTVEAFGGEIEAILASAAAPGG